MSRCAAAVRTALLASAAASSGCLTITSSLSIGPGGAVSRDVRVATDSAEAARKARERFAPPWTVADEPGGKSVAARLEIPAGQQVPPGETALVVEVRERFFYAEISYAEDWSKLRLGEGAPTIAPVPPPMYVVPAWIRLLAHEKNLSVMERRFRESVKVTVEAELPGRIVDGNFHERAGNRLRWSFDLRSPAAPRATSRVYRPMRIAGALSGAGLAAVLVLAKVRRRGRTARPA